MSSMHRKLLIRSFFVMLLVCSFAGYPNSATADEKPFKVALLLPRVIDADGWTRAGYKGLLLIKEKLGAEIAFTENVPEKDFEHVFRNYAQDGFNFIIGHGGQFVPAAEIVAREFPRTKPGRAGRSTVIAALTAHALEEEKEEILAAGFDDFVRKPFCEHEIFEVIAKHLDLRYVYDNGKEQTVPVESDMELHPESLLPLPDDLRCQLHKAVVELDTARTMELIEQISVQHTHIAGKLKSLAKRLDYGQLLKLLET